jgi:cytidylate kinase
MYRAATLAVLSTPTDLSDANAVAAVVARAVIDVGTDPHDPSVCLDGVRVDAPIRSAEVTAAVSEVSAVPAVRSRLVAAQRRIIGPGGIVVEGRDTGTVVWPTARPKVFLTANASVRARRRAGQLGDVPLAAVAADLTRRDRFDSTRPLSPLVQADDAIVVDTTDLSIDEVVDRLVDMAMNAHVETDG